MTSEVIDVARPASQDAPDPQMKTFTLPLVFACVACVGQLPAEAPKAKADDPAVIETIRKFERDVGDAMVAFDVDELDQAYADDWVTIGSDGNIFKKEGLLSDFKTGKHKLVSFENGPMSVQVIGDVALVQASVSEKRIQDGKDISGVFAFMDLLEKRAGKWVIVRTLGTRVNGASPLSSG
jgi:ketosteroid isomerase-like protein